MTCIAGVVHEGQVFIGGDSAGVGDYNLTIRADRKVFKNGPFIFGFTTSFRMGQLLQYSLTLPIRHHEKDVMAFMVTEFIDTVRQAMKNGGYARKDQEAERGGTFLVGYQGRLFQVFDDYQLQESEDRFDACGCGKDSALGALFSATDLPPKERIKKALEAAEHFSAGVRGPFHIESS